jgi:Micrococcal nuclease (thermonuclease) homologs
MKRYSNVKYNKKIASLIKKQLRKYPLIFSVFLLCGLAFYVYEQITIITTPVIASQELVFLERCIDGDTAAFTNLAGNVVKIRFSGINTPESSNFEKQDFGMVASDFTCTQLTTAKKITVEWDRTQTASYDREIGIIFVDDKNLNLLLLEQGYADLKYLKDTMPYAKEYRFALEKAQQEQVGRWQNTN